MKHTMKLFGIIAMVAVIGFSMMSCGGDDGGGGDGKSSGIEILNLSGRVYLEDWSIATSITYSNFNGSLTLDDYGDGSGSVTNGNLSYSIGTPSSYYLYQIDLEDELFWDYDVSPTTVKGFVLYGLNTNDYNGYIYKTNTAVSVRGNSFSSTDEWVRYVYVENDVTVNGTGETGTCTDTKGGTTYTETYTARNFTLTLKAGWNAVYYKSEESGTFTGPFAYPTNITSASTHTISLSNPALRWVLDDYVPPPTIPPANSTLLTFNTWANGNITNSVREQYFRFTATASQHYIHFRPGALDDVNVEIYNSNGSRVGDMENFYGSYLSYSWNLTSGQTYYIRVVPYYSGDSGSYQIAFNSSSITPLSASLSVTPSFNVITADTASEKTKRDGAGIFGLTTLRHMKRHRLPSAQK